MLGCGAVVRHSAVSGNRSISPRQWCSSRGRVRISSRVKPYGWTADCSRARAGRTRRSHDLFGGFGVGSINELCGDIGGEQGVEDAAVVKLNSAEAAMVDHASGKAFEKVEKTGGQGIDRVAILELLEPCSTTLRAAAIGTEMVLVAARHPAFMVAIPAGIDGQILKSFPECPVHPPDPSSAAGCTLSHSVLLCSNCGNWYKVVKMVIVLFPPRNAQ